MHCLIHYFPFSEQFQRPYKATPFVVRCGKNKFSQLKLVDTSSQLRRNCVRNAAPLLCKITVYL